MLNCITSTNYNIAYILKELPYHFKTFEHLLTSKFYKRVIKSYECCRDAFETRRSQEVLPNDPTLSFGGPDYSLQNLSVTEMLLTHTHTHRQGCDGGVSQAAAQSHGKEAGGCEFCFSPVNSRWVQSGASGSVRDIMQHARKLYSPRALGTLSF